MFMYLFSRHHLARQDQLDPGPRGLVLLPFDLAPELGRPLPHVVQAASFRGLLLGIEAAAIVVDRDPEASLEILRADRDSARPRVLGDVGDPLLEDEEELASAETTGVMPRGSSCRPARSRRRVKRAVRSS
jgi:hypothetical protein